MRENPKDALQAAEDRAPLDYLEPAGNEACARALKFGADKYGRRNFLKSPVRLTVYLAAMQRHIDAMKEGEDDASDSNIHHLGHVAASCHIVLAASKHGTLVDDRELTAEPIEKKLWVTFNGVPLYPNHEPMENPDTCWDAPSEHEAARQAATGESVLQRAIRESVKEQSDRMNRPTTCQCATACKKEHGSK